MRRHLAIIGVVAFLILGSFAAASYSLFSVFQERGDNRASLCAAINDGRANDRFFYQALLDARDLEENPLTPQEERLVAELFDRTEPFDCTSYIRGDGFSQPLSR